jgi:hypothetical protein
MYINKGDSYFVFFNGTKIKLNSPNNLPTNSSGILIKAVNDVMTFTYYDHVKWDVNQFSVIYNKAILDYERIDFISNGVNKSTIFLSNALPGFDEYGLRQQLYRTYGISNWLTCSYQSFTPNYYNVLRYTDTKEKLGVNSYGTRVAYGASKENITTLLKINNNTINKKERISYGTSPYYSSSNGFEIVQSFAIVKNKVTNDMVKYWVKQNTSYPVGGMKAAYGTFLTALSTILISDSTATELMSRLNISGFRNQTTIGMAGINNLGKVYVHIPDVNMGWKISGGEKNILMFNTLNSLMVSEAERMSMGFSGIKVNSSIELLVNAINNNQAFTITYDVNTNSIIIMLENSTRLSLVIDFNTGLIKSILQDESFEYKGATSANLNNYCYHNGLTNNLDVNLENLFRFLEDNAGGILVGLGVAAIIAGGPVTLSVIAVAIGVGLILDASGVTTDWYNLRKWGDALLSIGISVIPGGTAVKSAKIVTRMPWIVHTGTGSWLKGPLEQGSKYITRAVIGEDTKSVVRNAINDNVINYYASTWYNNILNVLGVPQ